MFIIAILIILAGFIFIFVAKGSSNWGIFVVGGGILALAIVSLLEQVQFLKRAHHAEGMVIAYERNWAYRNSPGNTNDKQYPVVRYALPDGRQLTFQANRGLSGIWIYVLLPISKKVGVLYDPLHPEHAMINTFWNFWAILGGLCFLGLCGLSLLVVGSLMLIK